MNRYWRTMALILAATNAFGAVYAQTKTDNRLTPGWQVNKLATDAGVPYLRWFDPQVKTKAMLLCVHGLGLHKGTFDAFGKKMAAEGVPTYAIDVRGFGSWMHRGPKTKMDLDGAMKDVKMVLEYMKKKHPGVPIVVLGESMGGAIALHATAQYPELVAGLISSVPAGDRFSKTDDQLGVAKHAIFKGFNKPMKVNSVVTSATKNKQLQDAWLNDPLARLELTPNELIAFQNFMNQNYHFARQIKEKPVLFIQGANDKLVRPAGTWKLFDELGTPDRKLVFSKTAEHLIFEEGQFSAEDVKFVLGWVDTSILKDVANADSNSALAALPPSLGLDNTGASTSTSSTSTPSTGSTTQTSTSTSTTEGAGRMSSAVNALDNMLKNPQNGVTLATTGNSQPTVNLNAPSISYWIELLRQGKVYRCNNKTEFKTGDAIRFHVIPATDGYAYIMMTASSRGNKSMLFPDKTTGTSNYLYKGNDYPLPYKGWLQFDNNPGVEKLSLIFSKTKLDPTEAAKPERYETAYVSSDRSGAKDLVPTRMQLSWDDATPSLITPGFTGGAQVARASTSRSSLVRVSYDNPEGVLSLDIALAHR